MRKMWLVILVIPWVEKYKKTLINLLQNELGTNFGPNPKT